MLNFLNLLLVLNQVSPIVGMADCLYVRGQTTNQLMLGVITYAGASRRSSPLISHALPTDRRAMVVGEAISRESLGSC